MTKQISKLLRYFCVFTSLLLFVAGLVGSNTNWLYLSIILMWLNNFLYSLEFPESRITQLMFYLSFFAFLLGRPIAELITVRVNYHHFGNDILIHTSVCLYVSLVTLGLAEFIFDHSIQFQDKGKYIGSEYTDNRTVNIRKTSIIFFYVAYPFAMLIIAEKILFVRAMGYVAYYTDYTSRFPYIVTKIGDMAEIALFMFLATMPSKKECKIPLALYLIQAFASLFTGKRGRFVVPIIFIVTYLVIRNRINTGEKKWFTKRMALIILACSPIAMVLLYVYSSVRVGNTMNSESFIDRLSGFLYGTGFSVNIINYEKSLEDVIPFRLYSFGDTIDYLRENIIISRLFNIQLYKNYTVGKALNSYSFPHVITYYYSPNYYLSGRGLGSCYIAEAYHDFGYFGVVLWNVIYAYVLKKMFSFESKGIVYTTLGLLSLRTIMLAPRNMASAFLTEWISIDNWLVIAGILFVSSIYSSRARSQNA